ncbi:unnamed protein product [Albugo candida]|uniref:Uncharacterized protein n=1 Tax=Albugo candida TaxID=65357 RepID=A0A024G1Z9_9STRA|nr:unnamed protein product [Albugo candida]|eukprot:CCI40691.1 unnamed protein product [Albugo candida]
MRVSITCCHDSFRNWKNALGLQTVNEQRYSVHHRIDWGSFTRCLPRMIGAPGKAFLVKTALNIDVGSIGLIRLIVIVAGRCGASCGTKSKLVEPAEKPSGKRL